MIIETERLVVRNISLGDTASLFSIFSDPEVMKHIERPYTYEQTEELMKEAGLSLQPVIYALQIEDTGELIAHVIYHPFSGEDCYEIGWVMAKEWWGKGFAGEITRAFIHKAMRDGLRCLVIECDPNQEASKKIALKNGFSYSGRLNNLDVYRLTL